MPAQVALHLGRDADAASEAVAEPALARAVHGALGEDADDALALATGRGAAERRQIADPLIPCPTKPVTLSRRGSPKLDCEMAARAPHVQAVHALERARRRGIRPS